MASFKTLNFVIMGLFLVLIPIEGKGFRLKNKNCNDTPPIAADEGKVLIRRFWLNGLETTKNWPSESGCNLEPEREWKCVSRKNCSFIQSSPAAHQTRAQTNLKKCRIKVAHKICGDGLESCWKREKKQKYTYPICLKERCGDIFIETDCPDKPIETTSITPTTTEAKIEDSGQSFTEEDLEAENFKCQANMSFKLACNTCWCDSDGEGPKYCTRVACNPKTYKPLP